MNTPILHAFDPKRKFLPPKNGEVRFVQGRYIDIAAAKGKDIHSLYFGTSKNSNLLTGIFLGDFELTSKVKDVSLVSKNGNIILSVKYINEDGKLATVKSNLPSGTAYQDIIKKITEFSKTVDKINSSITNLQKQIKVLDSSVFLIESKLNIIDSSLNDLINNLEDGKYNYTLRESISSFEDGCKKTYTLFKGDNEQTDSSTITLMDYVLKKLEYDDQTNSIIATIWPDACGDDMYKWGLDPDNNPIKTSKIKDDYVRTLELNLDSLETHIIDTINTDSIINDRIVVLESQLKWEDLFNE